MDKNYKTVYTTPQKFNNQNVKYFLKEAASMFKLVDKKVPNVLFQAANTKEASLVGLLLIYKFMEYSHGHNCFVHPTLDIDESLFKELTTNGFKDFIKNVTSNIPIEYDRLKFAKKQELFIAPVVLRRQNCNSSGVVGKIAEYYSYDSRIAFTVLKCEDEIESNFISHAVSDSESVLVAQGDKNTFELVCADTGDGIISTLRSNIPNGGKLSKHEILMKALEKGVSSKPDKSSFHMGYGLWFVNEIVKAAKGELLIFSEGAYYHTINGKIKKGECGFWKGTIICIKIPLYNREHIVSFLNKTSKEYKKYKRDGEYSQLLKL